MQIGTGKKFFLKIMGKKVIKISQGLVLCSMIPEKHSDQ